MKDQLPKFLQPTNDMKKAISRNAKTDEDLSRVLKQLDKEKKLAIEQLSRKQDLFKKEIIKRRESQSNEFKDQFFELRNASDTATPKSKRPAKKEASESLFCQQYPKSFFCWTATTRVKRKTQLSSFANGTQRKDGRRNNNA